MIRADDERLRKLLMGQERVLQEVFGILEEENKKDDLLRAVVLCSRGERVNHIARMDPERVFSRTAIKRICVTYGLRFLDAGCFKGTLPPRALYELRQLESRARAPLNGFKILAPASRFKLCDGESDPVLFVPVGPEHFYLVHKWGRDMSAWRAIRTWPFRAPVHLALSSLVLAVLVACVVPNPAFGAAMDAPWWGIHRFLGGIWTTMTVAAVVSFAWFTFFGQFSREAWNSEHFN